MRCAVSGPGRPLVELQLEVLYARDGAGRLVATRDTPPNRAPRLHVGRSSETTVWSVRNDVDPRTAAALHELCAGEAALCEPDPDRPPACRERVLKRLAPVAAEWRGPAWVLPEGLPRDDRARLLTRPEADAWRGPFPWIAEGFGAVEPVAVAFDGGRPAAVCHSPRGATPHAAEAGVETLEGHRNRGLATAAVACWARAVQRSGRLALYSTSWQNLASRRVAAHLGARLYGEDWHVR